MTKRNKQEGNRRPSKKDLVTGNHRQWTGAGIAGALVIMLALALGLLYWLSNTPIAAVSATTEVAAGTTAEEVIYPVAMFQDGQARHFEYQTDTRQIRYFILQSADGVIRAAFDACDVCWPSGKGYYQDGDYMVCRNCGREFAAAKINEVKGGCNPAPLKRTIQDGNLILQAADILTGTKYFDFQNGGEI
ncbi:MAG: DUF2318 domain-containing protein [Thermodesulfobacteriota bacterium]|nr:DUF2318 domain-containing protein [Thermodesulfobacteriota bacterium]